MKPILLKSELIDRKYYLQKKLAPYLPDNFPRISENYYLWNCGIEGWQSFPNGKIKPTVNWLEGIEDKPTTYIIEGILNPLNEVDKYKIIQLIDREYKQAQIIFIDSHLHLPLGILSLVDVKEIPLPNYESLEKMLSPMGHNSQFITDCLGLTYGEVLENVDTNTTVNTIHQLKIQKLSSKGLKIATSPDVPDIGGMDLLKADLEEIKHRFHPYANSIGLGPPKGVMLWGIPGTGKSLTAKLAAKMTGALLVQCDWNLLYGDSVAETLDNLDYMLNLVDILGKVILFLDEGEKALSGSLDGGAATKMTGKLLAWLQDHTTPVVLLMTINHLGLLPPEMFRRFEYIWFFNNDLHKGAMLDIFNLHLKNKFSQWQEKCFTDDEWEELFFQYQGYTPAEIATAIKQVQTKIFNQLISQDLSQEQLLDAISNYPLDHPKDLYYQL
ncbi:MAG: AAA family ATPase, partial [Crocosphaera sp.]